MKKYALLSGNKVIEVLETDLKIEDLFHPDMNWHLCNDASVKENYTYNGTTWHPPIEEGFSPEAERQWRNIELIRADEELNKVQDADSKARGTVAQWREYRRALRNYPESEGFASGSRPVSP